MLNSAEKAYCLALHSLRRKDYRLAADYFNQAGEFFNNNSEFCLLKETNRLLVAVKEELGSFESDERNEQLVIEEVSSYGQEDELR
jgi:hypothetical protein